MKKRLIIILIIFIHLSSYGQKDNDLSQAYYHQAYTALQNMLEGKDSLDYEKAVFICENAYHNNYFKYEDFKSLLDFHTDMITAFADNIRGKYKDKYAALKDYEQRMFNPNINNYAIFKYISDTAFVIINNEKYYKTPYNYTAFDPYGSNNWENTQVLSLLLGNEKQGNCYSLAVLFKLFADRLQSDARLTVTPHHIYIQNRNHRGGFCNIELASKTFPGDGSIQTLTYTTNTSIMNGMAQRMLNNKEAVALNLMYLAKAYQHKYKDNTNDFLLQCAELAIKHDSLSMNALLLKAEITENRLLAAMKSNKITTLSKARANNQTKLLLASYEKQLSDLYTFGYREIPKEIERNILARIQHKNEGYFLKDHTPNPFADIKAKTRYKTLSNGLFDEIHEAVDSIQYYHALLNTKTKKIIKLLPVETDNEYKVDPVVFALSVDPLSDKYPNISPYAYCAWNPVMLVDPDGREMDGFVALWNNNTSSYDKYKVNDLGGDKNNYTEFRGGILDGQIQSHNLKANTTSWSGISTSEISPITGSPTGKGTIEDANWIIDIAAGGFKGLLESGGKKLIGTGLAKTAENLADDAVKGGVQYSDDLVKAAQKLYPKKAGKIELHHPIPQYLGGSNNQTLVPLDAAYHQQITNAFRAEWDYGQGIIRDPVLRQKIADKVYSKFPLPK